MEVQQKIVTLLAETLSFSPEQAAEMNASTALLGEIPEFDSMAVVSVIMSIEELFELTIEDDDISAETFATVSSLVEFVKSKQL
jgi:acyl carrier protein